jgi:hypothetical protein
MNKKWTLVGALVALAAFPMASNAVATLSFSVNGGGAITCTDQDVACDANPAVGVVTYISSLAGGFVVNVTTGLSKPVLNTGNPLIDLNSVNVQALGGANTLTIMFSDTGFTESGFIGGEFGGTLSGPAGTMVTAAGYYSLTDALFAMDGSLGSLVFGTGAFAGDLAGGSVNGSPFSLTQVITLSFTGPGTYSGDFALKVPEPESLALLGFGLLGIGFATSRKRKA